MGGTFAEASENRHVFLVQATVIDSAGAVEDISFLRRWVLAARRVLSGNSLCGP